MNLVRFLFLAALASLITPQEAKAIFIPVPVIVDVIPWVPMPGEDVVLSITDGLSSVFPPAPPGRVGDVMLTRQGNQFVVAAILIVDGAAPSSTIHFPVDLGPLSAGQYVVSYSSTATTGETHQASLSFTVAANGYATAIEYFAPSLGHYFITSDGNEIAVLDNGVIPGWVRTGESFRVIPAATQPSSAASVCRFYGLPQAGLDSHFFTALNTECKAVQQKWPTIWILETTDAFAVPFEGMSGDACVPGSIPVYRLFNNRPDANHRYTISKAVRDQMLAQGWILEGAGLTQDDVKVMCAPQ